MKPRVIDKVRSVLAEECGEKGITVLYRSNRYVILCGFGIIDLFKVKNRSKLRIIYGEGVDKHRKKRVEDIFMRASIGYIVYPGFFSLQMRDYNHIHLRFTTDLNVLDRHFKLNGNSTYSDLQPENCFERMPNEK